MDSGDSTRIHTEPLRLNDTPQCAECGKPIVTSAILYGDRPFHTYTELVAWKQRKEAV